MVCKIIRLDRWITFLFPEIALVIPLYLCSNSVARLVATKSLRSRNSQSKMGMISSRSKTSVTLQRTEQSPRMKLHRLSRSGSGSDYSQSFWSETLKLKNSFVMIIPAVQCSLLYVCHTFLQTGAAKRMR